MLLRGGTVIDVDGTRHADVRVSEAGSGVGGDAGRVVAVGAGLEPSPAGEPVVDCTGLLVVPGGVDAHTHFHLPVGSVRVSDDFWTGTRAAAVGGTTCVIDYVTAYRGEDPMAALATWRRWAEPATIDYGLHMTFTERVGEGVIADCVEAGVTSFKLYMAYPSLLQVDDDVILEIMLAARRHGGLVTVHCENGGAIEVLRRRALAEGRTGVLEHARTRPAVLEGEAVTRAVALAEVAEAPVYLVHLSSAPALQALREGQARGVSALGETCPQYLYLDTARLAGPDGENYVCTPPLRDPWHAEELWEGLAQGTVQTVATDHCPFAVSDREAGVRGRPEGFADFTEIPGGLPGVETRMALVWRGVVTGRLTAADWVRLCCEAPARTFGLWPAKGSLRVGADADVVVWDPDRRQGMDASALHMHVDHSPYASLGEVLGWPQLVLSRGRVVASGGEPRGEPGWGRYVARAPVAAVGDGAIGS
ncbi:MAG TPA: dihydropyrimidinase [Acidimicrobiales bacterium]|jgi:dihydropyrimidinase|nr:dihydropyrimidinase [Acidimicrobiales bacterium]